MNWEEHGQKPKIFASHSNCKKICNHNRNLTDKQILEIKEQKGIIGIVSAKPFCIEEKKFNKDKIKYENAYIEHIKHLKELLNGVDNIAVSTDDMRYYKTNRRYYRYFNVFTQEDMKERLEKLLLNNGLTVAETEKILYKNAERFLEIN